MQTARGVIITGCRLIGWLVIASGLVWSASGQAARTAPASQADTLAALIQQLGAPEYARRQQARDELRQLGVAAFEALHAAQSHPDVEIRKQAEYLLRAIRINWVQDEDPEEIKQLLRSYQQDELDDRLLRLDQLGRVEHVAAWEALCRLARFETSDVLSRRAALAVMRHRRNPLGGNPAPLIDAIRRMTGDGTRVAVRWLQVYADSLVSPQQTRTTWQEMRQAELAELERRPEKDRIAVARDFLRWQIEMLQDQGQLDEALVVMRQLIPLQGAGEDELLETTDWLIRRELWPLIETLIAGFPRSFHDDPQLMYRRAELLVQQGKQEDAEALIQQILAIVADNDQPFLHVELAYDLQTHGRTDWAEREYRHAIQAGQGTSHAAIEAAIRLGDMFHDLGRHADAYEAFKALVQRIESDKSTIQRLQDLPGRQPNRVLSQMHFSRALMLGEQQAIEEQQKALSEALTLDQENADILIAMYRIAPASDEWVDGTKHKVDRLRQVYQQRVTSAQRDFEALPGQFTAINLARQLNQLAWLISNTYGDFDAAVRHSRRSLELIPEEAGYLDTLARCYFAANDLDSAVRYQRRAVELEPHSGQIRRQLELFEHALANRAASTTSTGEVGR
jgi:tetratricopeptide (TPR) repeat protein